MKAAVDSSIILDILLDDPDHAQNSMNLLEGHLARGAVVICPVAYAESWAPMPARAAAVSARITYTGYPLSV